MSKPSIRTKRLISGISSLLLIACIANYYGELGWFGSYARDAIAVSAVMVFLVVTYLGPFREMSPRKSRE